MNIFAITMVRDELDILPYTLPHLADQVDHVIVADNNSTDGTSEYLSSLDREKFTVIDDPEVGYFQDQKMTDLAMIATEEGADWIVPFDADEAWTLRNLQEFFDSDIGVVYTRSYVYVPCNEDNHNEPNPLFGMIHRQTKVEPFPKVTFRANENAWIHMGNHNVSNVPGRAVQGHAMRHYQYRSLDQVKRKVRNGCQAYAATNMSEDYGLHWRKLNELSDQELETWWLNYTNQPLIKSPWPDIV